MNRHSPSRSVSVVFFVLVAFVLMACSSPSRMDTGSKAGSTIIPDISTATATLAPVPPPTDTPPPATLPPVPPPTAPPPPATLPSGISWDQAGRHVGEYATVCGPVVATSYRPNVNGGPTWLNVGRNYPDTSRFQVVIWAEDRGNFPQAPEAMYQGATICVTGAIDSYGGVTEMEVAGSSSIVIP